MLLTVLGFVAAMISLPPVPAGHPEPEPAGVPRGHLRAAATGPGRLLTYPLIYRGRPKGDRRDRYTVFFRVRAPFAGRDDVGTTVPGELRVEDAYDSHDGFGGAVSAGRPRGKCYAWYFGADQRTPKLDAEKIGARVAYRFALRKTSRQSGSATLRPWPSADGLARDLRSIGCRTATR
jgi:hypothetical protein